MTDRQTEDRQGEREGEGERLLRSLRLSAHAIEGCLVKRYQERISCTDSVPDLDERERER